MSKYLSKHLYVKHKDAAVLERIKKDRGKLSESDFIVKILMEYFGIEKIETCPYCDGEMTKDSGTLLCLVCGARGPEKKEGEK